MHTHPITADSSRSSCGSDERGFTLSELLVATAITLTVGGAAMTAAVHFGRNTLSATGMTDLNQNLRIAMNLVVRDMLQAGLEIPVGGIPMPSGPTVLQKVLRPGPMGSDIEFDEEWTTIPAVVTGHGLGPLVNGVHTDIVTLLRGDFRLPWDTLQPAGYPIMSADGTRLTFPAGFPIDGDADGVKKGDLIMLRTNAASTLMEVTNVAGQVVFFGAEAESHLNQHNAPGGVLQLNPSGLDFPVRPWRIVMVTYYLDTSGEAPALMRRQGYGEERKIALGIEDMQLTWDLVDSVDSAVDEPEAPDTPHQIRKANLQMAARTFDRSTTGTHLHVSLKTQVSLRSLAFVDRYK
jgi:hypothetical protein